MWAPVERSIRVSPPQRDDHTLFSTSFSMSEPSAELPMLVFILTKNLDPIIIGSASGWLGLQGSVARPAAISSRTNSAVMYESPSLRPIFSRIATYSISGVTMPCLANAICVKALPLTARLGRFTTGNIKGFSDSSASWRLVYSEVKRPSCSTLSSFWCHASRNRGKPLRMSIFTSGSVKTPLVS